MPEFEITEVRTSAEFAEDGKSLRQWVELKLKIEKGFDWSNGAAIMKKLKAAHDLIGKG